MLWPQGLLTWVVLLQMVVLFAHSRPSAQDLSGQRCRTAAGPRRGALLEAMACLQLSCKAGLLRGAHGPSRLPGHCFTPAPASLNRFLRLSLCCSQPGGLSLEDVCL